jgi:hypothetical protein
MRSLLSSRPEGKISSLEDKAFFSGAPGVLCFLLSLLLVTYN